MSQRELFQIWAPAESAWSVWAKPVLFANAQLGPTAVDTNWPEVHLPFQSDTAVIVELPEESSISFGIALARKGYRPVPLFNCAPGPSSVVPWQRLVSFLEAGAEELRRLNIQAEAPPAFLLDSKRLKPTLQPVAGTFDNRWMVFPQDFPSAGFLKAHGITKVILLQTDQSSLPQDDLAHVLLRWKLGGLELWTASPTQITGLQSLEVQRPSRFRGILYRITVLMGLRRNSTGGFGGLVPVASSGG
jgi:hypothetical protein